MLSKLFHVIDKIPGSVLLDACMWRTPPCTPLVEQNDAIEVGIKESSVSTACPASWSSMKEYNSLQKQEIYQNTSLDRDPISFTLTTVLAIAKDPISFRLAIVLAMAKERKHFLKKQIFSSQRRR
jgi:hypothetical protein